MTSGDGDTNNNKTNDRLDTPKVTIEDTGAHELAESSESDDNFTDAQSVQDSSSQVSPSFVANSTKLHQDSAHQAKSQAQTHDMVTNTMKSNVIHDEDKNDNLSTQEHASRPSTPGGQPIPITIVERVDDEPAYGETPGTEAHDLRRADAVPDLIVRHSRSASIASQTIASPARSRAGSTPGDLPIPTTRVEKVDDKPSHGEVPGTEAYEKREEDAQPDEVAVVGDAPDLPTLVNSSETVRTLEPLTLIEQVSLAQNDAGHHASAQPAEYNVDEDGDDNVSFVAEDTKSENGDEKEEDDFGDDFDDFEEGDDDGDFDDFESEFQAPDTPMPLPQVSPPNLKFPMLNFDRLKTHDDVLEATAPHMSALFPLDTIDVSALPVSAQHDSVFLTDRSASLWSQLVAPPPLQPPNWIRSRIRRLFLVSLGVPVDLDEILPASKQKKLILPSTLISDSDTPRSSTDLRNLQRLKGGLTDSTTSVDSTGKPKDPSVSKSKSRRGPPPPPGLDTVAARQLCSITDEKLKGFDENELKDHVERLKDLETLATEVLDYWTKRTDEQLGDREAFEGVIENLVKHARKVRK